MAGLSGVQFREFGLVEAPELVWVLAGELFECACAGCGPLFVAGDVVGVVCAELAHVRRGGVHGGVPQYSADKSRVVTKNPWLTVIGLPSLSVAPVVALAVTVAVRKPRYEAAMVGMNVMEACPAESVGVTTAFCSEPSGAVSPPAPDVTVKITKAFGTGLPFLSVVSTVNGATFGNSPVTGFPSIT